MRSVPGVKDSAHLKQDLPASQCVGTLGVNMSAHLKQDLPASQCVGTLGVYMSAHLRVRKAIVGLSAGCALFQV